MLSLSYTPDHALDEDILVPEIELPDAPNKEFAADPQKDADDAGEPTPVLDTTQRRAAKRKSSRKKSSSQNRCRVSFRKSPMTLVFAQNSAEAGDTGASTPSECPEEEAVDWRGPLLKVLWPLGRSCGKENDGFPADIFAIAEKLVENEDMSSGDIDILEVAKAKGMSFPPPRWHRPGGYDAEQVILRSFWFSFHAPVILLRMVPAVVGSMRKVLYNASQLFVGGGGPQFSVVST